MSCDEMIDALLRGGLLKATPGIRVLAGDEGF
jgi:hypothetical protein